MKASLTALLFVALLQGEESVARISVADAKKAADANAVLLLDVRDASSYAAGHIAGALSMPEADLKKYVPRLKSEKRPIVAYCS